MVESATHRERVLHASLSSHQGNCTVCSDWTAPCGRKDSAYCLEPEHALWNKIYRVSILDRFRSVAFTVHMKKIFLQVCILEGKSDALRFHYLCDLHSIDIQILRFAMVPFCLVPSFRRSNCATSADCYPTTAIQCSVILRDICMLTISSMAVLLSKP